MNPRPLLVSALALTLFTGCENKSKTNTEGADSYPRLKSIEQVVEDSAKADSPDPMAYIIWKNLKRFPEITSQNYPVVIFWILPSGINSALDLNSKNLDAISTSEDTIKFVKSHIVPEDIEGIDSDSPEIKKREYKNLNGENIYVESKYNPATSKNVAYANGIAIKNCYFVEDLNSNDNRTALGKICYIEQPLFNNTN